MSRWFADALLFAVLVLLLLLLRGRFMMPVCVVIRAEVGVVAAGVAAAPASAVMVHLSLLFGSNIS